MLPSALLRRPLARATSLATTTASRRSFGGAASSSHSSSHSHRDEHHDEEPDVVGSFARSWEGGVFTAVNVIVFALVVGLRSEDSPAIFAKEHVLNRTDFKAPQQAAYPF